MNIRRIAKRSYVLWSLRQQLSLLKNSFGGGYFMNNKGCTSLKKNIVGTGNGITIGEGTRMDKSSIYIRGNNNRLTIGENCVFGKDCSFRIEGNNISIIIGDNCTFTRNVNFTAQEDKTHIEVGQDCMFSNTIVVRTSDSHPIYSIETKERINPPASVHIGNHVWLAPNSKVMKGAYIGDGCVIGSETMVNKQVPHNVLVVGTPSRIVKENIEWTRERLF